MVTRSAFGILSQNDGCNNDENVTETGDDEKKTNNEATKVDDEVVDDTVSVATHATEKGDVEIITEQKQQQEENRSQTSVYGTEEDNQSKGEKSGDTRDGLSDNAVFSAATEDESIIIKPRKKEDE